MSRSGCALVLFSAVLALARISGEHSQAFQAIAHLYVGWLVSAWWHLPVSYTVTGHGDYRVREMDNPGRLYLILAVGLSVIELVCFLVSRFA